jgi:hypothetical protein
MLHTNNARLMEPGGTRAYATRTFKIHTIGQYVGRRCLSACRKRWLPVALVRSRLVWTRKKGKSCVQQYVWIPLHACRGCRRQLRRKDARELTNPASYPQKLHWNIRRFQSERQERGLSSVGYREITTKNHARSWQDTLMARIFGQLECDGDSPRERGRGSM